MRAVTVIVLSLSLASTVLAQTESRRGVPAAMRRALVGCWTPWPGERWTFEAHGATGLVVRIGFPRAEREALRERFGIRGTVRPSRETVSYRPDDGVAVIGCGPTTQHGQFCVLSWTDERLVVRRYARGWGRHRHRGRLVDTVTAQRCSE